MKKDYNHIVVCGSVAYDEIMDFPGKFVDFIDKTKLHQINVSFVVDKLEKQFGGIATNIAYNLRLLTNKRIGVISAVGKDAAAFMSFFKKNDIDISQLIQDQSTYTATGKVITDMADNQIWGYFYGPLHLAQKITIKSDATNKTLYILAPTHAHAFLKHQHDLISNQCDFVYDPGMALTWIADRDLKDGITSCKWLVGNDYEIAQIIKRCNFKKEKLLNEGIIIITTLGEKGVLYESKSETHTFPAFKIAKTIDPTGAGDAWRGGFFAGVIDGKSVKKSLLQANTLASFAVESYGTVNHKPTRKQIEERIKKLSFIFQ